MAKGREGITINQYYDWLNTLPDEVRFIHLASASQTLIGLSTYTKAVEKYPEYFDQNGNVKPMPNHQPHR